MRVSDILCKHEHKESIRFIIKSQFLQGLIEANLSGFLFGKVLKAYTNFINQVTLS